MADPSPAHEDLVEGFAPISWLEDSAERVRPDYLSQLLRDAVPALAWLDWRLTEIPEGAAQSLLPLNDESTNHNGTHQAALMALAADYTGGAALLSLVRGIPALGLHPLVGDGESCAMWTVGFEMDYLLPSAAPLVIRARIPEERWKPIRDLYLAGRTVIEAIEVLLESDGEIVARGRYRYFLKQTSKLGPTELSAKPNPVFAHRGKASARLIAGLRAAETREAAPRIRDPWAEELAGPHGAFLARRFQSILPPLRDMVVARTLDIDRLVEERVAAGTRQLVLVGTGFDMRPFRLLGGRDVEVFELDLPHMLRERERLLSRLGTELPAVRRVAVPFDLRLASLSAVLATTSFRVGEPALFVIEGVTMYLDAEVARRLVDELARLLEHPESVAWLDIVKSAVVRRTGVAGVDSFVTAMQQLGEPFTFGLDDPESFVGAAGLSTTTTVSSRVALRDDPVFALYDFLHVRRAQRPST